VQVGIALPWRFWDDVNFHVLVYIDQRRRPEAGKPRSREAASPPNLKTRPLTSIFEDKTDRRARGALCSPPPWRGGLDDWSPRRGARICLPSRLFCSRVEADEHELPAPVHDYIVIAIVLVLCTIPRVRALVGLDADQRVIDAQAVVDAPPMRAITVGRVYWCVVAKILEIFFQKCTSLQLFEAVCFYPWVVRKKSFEARRAKAVVIPVTNTRV
jgi:hypothetical protein